MRKLLALASLLGCLADDPSAPRAIQVPDAAVLGPTRLYFRDAANTQAGLPATEQSNRTADVTWDGANVNRQLSLTKGESQDTARLVFPGVTTIRHHYLRRFVSRPFDVAQTAGGGTYTYNRGMSESGTNANFKANGITAYVWRPSTQAVVGYLIDLPGPGDNQAPGQEPLAPEERLIVTTAISTAAVGAAAGDVLVVEVWGRFSQSNTNTFTLGWYYDGATVTEAQPTQVIVSDHASYIEFSEVLTFEPEPPEGVVIPASIDATGATDVTEPLQAWLDSLPDSTTIVGPAGARYRVEFGIELFGRHALTFTAADTTNDPALIQTVLEPYGAGNGDNRNRFLLAFRTGGGHAINNWKLDGSQEALNSGGTWPPYNPDLEAQHALLIAGVTSMLVEDVFITQIAGDMVYLNDPGIGGQIYRNQNVTIRRVVGRYSGRQGVAPVGCTNCLIENSDFANIARSAIDIEPNSGNNHVVNLTIRNNKFALFNNNWVAGAGDGDATVDRVTIENNEVVGRVLVFDLHGRLTTSPNTGKRRTNLRILNNHAHSIPSVSASQLRIIHVGAVDTVEVSGNTVQYTGANQIFVGTRFNEACEITYSGNSWGSNLKWDHEVTTGHDSVLVDVAPPGAAVGDTLVPVSPVLSGSISNGTKINFPTERFLRLKRPAPTGEDTLVTDPLQAALVDSDVGQHRKILSTFDGADLEWYDNGVPMCP